MPDVIKGDVPAGNGPSTTLLDRSDERVKHESRVGGAISAFLERVRSGDLGALPVVMGLLIIWTVFERASIRFFSQAATSSTCCSTVRVTLPLGENRLHVTLTNIFNKDAALFDALNGFPYAGYSGPYLPKALSTAPHSLLITLERKIGK
jgi:hypothetical protein